MPILAASMFRAGPVTFDEPLLALVALGLSLVAIVVALRRRVDLPPASRLLLIAGLVLLSLAAGVPGLDRRDADEVIVMVDLSPSTRTARYRDPEFLHRRIAELLGSTPHRTICFSDGIQAGPPTETNPLSDLPADQTRFAPPDAQAILLFSDAQFEIPAVAPPTYTVVDPLLESPPDASVEDLDLRNDTTATATVRNSSAQSRTLTWLPSGTTQPITTGTLAINSPTNTSTELAAQISPGDAWPENDAMRIHAAPPDTFEHWWVGDSPAPDSWRRMAPSELPTDPSAYLAPSVIALDNVAAGAFSDIQQQRLHQYVRDLGGAVLILGGDRSFAAGGYSGTTLDALSPLSSVPPTPTVHWLLLADSSGSMAAMENGQSRWDLLRQSLRALLPHLPPEDPVSIGRFAEDLRWWSTGRSAKETQDLQWANGTPHGPTNLESALNGVISQSDSAMPKELLLLTDADAQLTQVEAIAKGLVEKRIRLHLLALRDDGRALKDLERLVQATGGQSVRQLDPAKWAQSVLQLFQQAAPDLLIKGPMEVAFLPPLNLPTRTATPSNRTWLNSQATLLAESQREGEKLPMAARWNLGTGSVLATAFSPAPAEVQALARQTERAPHDPRFRAEVRAGARLVVTVDATDGDRYLNNLALTLEISDLPPTADKHPHAIPQVAPGRYELDVPAPTRPALATVRQGDRVLARRAVAERYPPEFESIGNNGANMRELATRSGGQVIAPTQTTPIAFNLPERVRPLTSWTAAASALLIAAGLIRWRMG